LLDRSLIVIIPLSISAVWYLILSIYGIALTNDTLYYFHASIEIFDRFNTEILSPTFPPFYPLLLAFVEVFGITPIDASVLIASASLFITIYFFMMTLYAVNVSRAVRIVALILLLMPGTLYTFHYALTDSLFIAISTATIYFVIRHSQNGNIWFFITACVLVSIAALTRYVGYYLFALIGIYILYYFLCIKRSSLNRRLFSAVAVYYCVVLLASVPNMLWLLRNLIISGTAMGARGASVYSLWQTLGFITNYIFLNHIALILLVITALLLFRKRIYARLGRIRTILANAPLMIILCAIALYCALLIYSQLTTDVEYITTRYVAPIAPLLVALFAIVIDSLFADINYSFAALLNAAKSLPRAFKISLSVIIFCSFAYDIHYIMNKPVPFSALFDSSNDKKFGYILSQARQETSNWLKALLQKGDVTLIAREAISDGSAFMYRTTIFSGYTDFAYSINNGNLTLTMRETNAARRTVKITYINAPSNEDYNRVQNGLGYAAIIHKSRYNGDFDRNDCRVSEFGWYVGVVCGDI
jgi:4-amino-4-deoxy-L-arabinose transferase-like glycosyltransferase